jgi:hypothetical protein
MADFRVTVDSAQVRHLLSKLSGTDLRDAVTQSLNMTAADIEAEIKDRMSGRTLKVRSGTYRRSVKTVPAKMVNGRMQASVNSGDFPGASLLEYGGTVRPKSRRVLTIPIPGGGVLTASGKRRFDAPTALRSGAFFVSSMASRTQGGFQRNRLAGGMIARSAGRRLIPLFALKRSVTIRPHPMWGPVAAASRTLAFVTLERVLSQKIVELGLQKGR